MLIQQISSSDTITQQFIARMIMFAKVFLHAEFYRMSGNADSQRKDSAASGGKFRAVNSDYPENKIDPIYASPALKIFGDKVEVDRAHERRGFDIPSVRATDLLAFAETLGQNFQYMFFNGSVAEDIKQFNGLKNIIPAAQKVTPAANGFQVLAGNDNNAKKSQQAFLESLDYLIQLVKGGAQVIYMNPKLHSRLTTIAREFIRWEKNEFGIMIPYYNEVPIINAGYNAAGTLAIPQDEVCGESKDCTSVYAVRFGEKSNLTLPTNVGIEVKDLGLVGVHYTHSVDFDTDLALLSDKSVARLEGVRIG